MNTITTNTTEHAFPYRWTLQDAVFTGDRGKVFSCFACGGGSSMGYKLAGMDVIGCNEIDRRVNECYVRNLHPRHNYLMPISELVTLAQRHDLPDELYHLDILDGSPPCSSFSTQGVRDQGWGKEKHFREGQTAQVLDTLFFDFIALADALRPKIVIAENVKGLLLGKARQYVRRIYAEMDKAGYYVQHYLLDASRMGVPQQRERVFFLCLRKDISEQFLVQQDLFTRIPHIDMYFHEPQITMTDIVDYNGYHWERGSLMDTLWQNRRRGDMHLGEVHERMYGKPNLFAQKLVYPDRVCPTLTSESNGKLHFDEPCFLSRQEVCSVSSFPQDYDFCSQKPHYVCGMSVPPVMMAHVATKVWEAWLSRMC